MSAAHSGYKPADALEQIPGALAQLYIPGDPPPSLNEMLRVPWRQRLRLQRAWEKDTAAWALVCRMPRRPLPGRPRVTFCFTFRALRRRDRDNLAASMKWILDELVRYGVLRDDSEESIDLRPAVVRVDRARPSTHVIVDARPAVGEPSGSTQELPTAKGGPGM